MTRSGTEAALEPAPDLALDLGLGEGTASSVPPVDGPEPAGGWPRLAWLLDKTTGFLFVAALLAASGFMLAGTVQGLDLLQTVADRLEQGPNPHRILVALLLTTLLLGLQAWFWTRAIVEHQFGPRDRWPRSLYLVWTPRVLGVLPFVVVAAGFARLPRGAGRTQAGWEIWALLLAGALFLLFVILRPHLETRLRNRAARLEAEGRPRAGLAIRKSLKAGHDGLLAASLIGCALGLAVACLWPVQPAQYLGPAAVALLALALIIPVMTVLIQAGWAVRVHTVPALFALALVFSLWVDNHRVRLSPSPAQVQEAAIRGREDIPAAFARWRIGLPDGGAAPTPIIFVAAQGGASRAGFWTADALAMLDEQTGGRFSRHLFAISSVSGASLGAAGFLAAIHDQPDLARQGALRPTVERFVQQDYLSPAIGGLLFPDLVQHLLPLTLLPDRAETLERGWEVGWRKACAGAGCRPSRMQDDFLDLWKDRRPGVWLPILMIGGATQETGRPLITSSAYLGRAPSTPFVDADDFHATAHRDVRLSTAILNGARFPYISPAGTLPNGQHIVDGGYFDAAGVEAVRELARSMFAPGTGVLGTGGAGPTRFRPIFLLILNGGLPDAGPAPERPHRNVFAQDMLGPLRGLYHSRSAHGDRLLKTLQEETPGASDTPGLVLELQVCESLAMDWTVSPTMAARLRGDLTNACGGNAQTIRTLEALLPSGS
jgi:hypothetical protein